MKKKIYILTVFFISNKNGVKIFLKLIINQYPKIAVNMSQERKQNLESMDNPKDNNLC